MFWDDDHDDDEDGDDDDDDDDFQDEQTCLYMCWAASLRQWHENCDGVRLQIVKHVENLEACVVLSQEELLHRQ